MMMRRVNVVKLVVASDYLSAKHKGVQNGTSIPVKIGQKEFASKQKVRGYYMDQRPDVKAVGIIQKVTILKS